MLDLAFAQYRMFKIMFKIFHFASFPITLMFFIEVQMFLFSEAGVSSGGSLTGFTVGTPGAPTVASSRLVGPGRLLGQRQLRPL